MSFHLTMDVCNLKVLILLLFCVCPSWAEQNESEDKFYLDVSPEHQMLTNISDLIHSLLKEQDQRFYARMNEFEDRIQDMIESLAPCISQKTTDGASRENDRIPNEVEQPNERTCRDLNNSVIPENTTYHPYFGDPCIFCMCRGGEPAECGTVMCDRPTCEEYTMVPGKCCDYHCEENEVNEIEILPTPENRQPEIEEDPPSFVVRPEDTVVGVGMTVTLQCVVSGNPLPTLYWKKDSYQQTLMFPNFNDGKYSVASDGTLRITNTELEDAGEYACEGSNAFGTATTTVRVEIREGTCSNWNGTKIMEGDVYAPSEGDPCYKCTCEGGFPIHCYAVNCLPPECENYVQTEGVCCDFTCLPDPENVIRKDNTGHCIDWNNTIIAELDTYAPKRSDPCYKCICEAGEPIDCYAVNCLRPECDNFVPVEGVCCEFTCLPPAETNEIQQDSTDYRCTDRNGTIVMDGDAYEPDKDDPCLQCTCDSGYPIKCFLVNCLRPECEHFIQNENVCCEFTCISDSNGIQQDIEGGCHDLNNTNIKEGETYYPYKDDPCIFCTCMAGNPVTCGSEQCGKPSCLSYTPILGTCCDYVCNEQATGAPNSLSKTDQAKLSLDTADDQIYFCGEPGCRLEYHKRLEDHKSRCNISIGVKTLEKDGMIFYSMSSVNTSNYQMLWLSSGKVVYSFDLGSGIIELASQKQYNDDKWHMVDVIRNRNIDRLFVDGEEVNFGISSGERIPSTEPHVYYVGAVPSEGVEKTKVLSIVKPFMGCLRQFRHNGEGVGPPTVAMETEPCFILP